MKKIETKAFIQEKFAEYYNQNSSSVEPPSSVEEREFAFLLLKEKVMLRHKGFRSVDELRNMLRNVVPAHVYYSTAYYEKPEEGMDAKGWLGADLYFDIDADHMPTPCNKQHDTWSCNNCGNKGRGAPPEKCPTCGGQKFDDKSWPCEVCLESTKKETIKVTEVLEEDFGFSLQEMTLAFSGHRGYHVHVENEVIRTLDSMSRKEIVDYLMGIGLEPSILGFDFEKAAGARLEDHGWRGRIAKGVYGLLMSPQEQLEKEGLGRISRDIALQRKQILEKWKQKGPWGLVTGVGQEGWRKIVQKAVETQSVKIDTVVTTDIHRLIRLANTLHGKTGLKKIQVPISEIEQFDPLKSALAFKGGGVRLVVSEAPEFRLGDERYGPYQDNDDVELPTAAALFLLCKGAARVKEVQ